MYQLYPRLVAFRDGKAVVAGNPAHVTYGPGVTKSVISLPSDHFDFAGPVRVEGLTASEIEAQVEKFLSSL